MFLVDSILSKKERKDLKFFFYVVPTFNDLRLDLAHLAHLENTQIEIFQWWRLKNKIALI
jgi:hypothetical protein